MSAFSRLADAMQEGTLKYGRHFWSQGPGREKENLPLSYINHAISHLEVARNLISNGNVKLVSGPFGALGKGTDFYNELGFIDELGHSLANVIAAIELIDSPEPEQKDDLRGLLSRKARSWEGQ